MKTAEETLAGLVDREEIRDLPARYCDCVWRGDVSGIVELFTVDGSFVVKAPEGEDIHRGREALLKIYTEGLRDLQPRPYIHNHVVELGYDGRATGRCYVDLRSEKRNMEWIGAGYYDDEYVKVGEHWKFASRYFTVLRLDSAPTKSAAKPRAVRVAATPNPAKAKVSARRKTAPAKHKSGR